MIYEDLGVFVKTLTVDDKYFLSNSENLSEPIQMQLSKKRKTVSQIFAAVLKFNLNFHYFQRKDDSHRLFISEDTDSQRCGWTNI